MSARELELPEIVRIARSLGHWADQGGLDIRMIWGELGLRAGDFQTNDSSDNLWYETTRKTHAGKSKTAGYGRDAVARLADAVAKALQGNEELSRLAYGMGIGGGSGCQTTAATIFLSYASADRTAVDTLYDALRRAAPQLALFQDHRSIAAGSPWLDEIRRAAGSASLLICWLTPSYLASAFCNYEVGLAESLGVKILPVSADSTLGPRVPAYLSQRQMIRVNGTPDFGAIAQQLVAALP